MKDNMEKNQVELPMMRQKWNRIKNEKLTTIGSISLGEQSSGFIGGQPYRRTNLRTVKWARTVNDSVAVWISFRAECVRYMEGQIDEQTNRQTVWISDIKVKKVSQNTCIESDWVLRILRWIAVEQFLDLSPTLLERSREI